MVKTTAARLVARVELDGNTLTAHAADATVLWRYLVRHTGPQLVLHGIGRVDWQGRGDADILAFIDGTAPTDTSLLAGLGIYCFSSAGRLKWRYQPRGEITFSNRVFSGPWRLKTSLIAAGRTPQIWASFVHDSWWPSFVVALGASGTAALRFVNAGPIHSLGSVENATGTYLLAGGANDEYRSAMLAVLASPDVAAASPQTAGSAFARESCQPGGPRKYVLFPPSELSVALGDSPRSVAESISVDTKNSVAGIEVSVGEAGGPPLLRTVYRLSSDFTPESVGMSAAYWEKHRELSDNGTLDHSPADCAERNGMVVRVWEPDTQWRQVNVPATRASRVSTVTVAVR